MRDSIPSECHGENEHPLWRGTESGTVGARDDGLDRLAELWPRLSEFDRLALLDHAEHLVALRGGGEAVAGLDGGHASESRLPAYGGSGRSNARPVKGRGKRDAGERLGVDSSLR